MKVAIHSLTGCAGCQLTIYFMEDLLQILENVELVAAPMISSNNSNGPYDLLFLEGSISSEHDLKRAKELRSASEVLVALGTCACFGNVQGQKHKLEVPAHLKSIKSTGLDSHIDVDYFLPGCTPDKDEIRRFIKDMLLNKKPQSFTKPVCYYCTIKENACLLEQGKECLGPLTNGACGALCPSSNHVCTGCRGNIEDQNFPAQKKLLKTMIDENLIKHKTQKYSR